MAVVLEFVGAIVLLGGVGYLVDERSGEGPVGVLVGVLCGVAVGTYILLKQLLKLTREGEAGRR
ncbi:MAG: AtpZ/AtpI family protein [Planctomycetes bacterium]|nr:AtpZ/AtpI family protein [Planctomycetota bacterium]